jgi:uroporphyrinogen decarboxylase
MSIRAEAKPLLRALRGETLLRPPFWLMRQAGRYLPEYREIRRRVGGFLDLCFNPELAAEVTLQPVRRYGMDAAILFSDILVVPHALGQKVAFREGEGPVLRPVRSLAELRGLSTARLAEHTAPVYETVRRVKQDLPEAATLIGFAGSPWTVATYMVEGGSSRDFERTKLWAFTAPDEFASLIELLVEATTLYLAAQIEAGAEVIQLFDSWAGALDEKGFRRWVIEPTRQIVARLRESHPSVPIIGFPRMAGFLYRDYKRETGVDAISLDTTVPLAAARDELQTLGPVQGNLDPLLLVAGGAAMESVVRAIIAALGNGAFVFNLGHGIVPQTPPENVARLAEIIRAG